ncbi:MAG TPA: hypothetical protein VJ964_16015, partial [Balneolaceae bacterium]|nr:hypothetical protein [Balneolaceae bacterium]
MKKTLHFIACLGLLFSVWACERPKSPNFKLDRKVQAPLAVSKTYPFLGGSESIIDTTSSNFDSLFSTNSSNGLVRLTKQKAFNFGNLNNAIPNVSVTPATVNAQVGEIGLNNFSSASPIGTANFQAVTGYSGSYQKGDPVPPGSTPGAINISFSTNYFKSAVIKRDGGLKVTITNNIGFNIDQLTLTLNAGSGIVGTATIGQANNSSNSFNYGDTKTTTITIPASTQLHDLNVDINASWSAQTMQADANNLVINDVTGQNLVASQLTAAIDSQTFIDAGTSGVDSSSFKFTQPDHFVELSSGNLSLNITNNIDIGIRDLKISFPDIRDKSTDTPLVLNLSGIPRSSAGGNYSNSFDLSGYRIYALNNTLSYDIDATTENTQQASDSIRTVAENDDLQATIALNNLQISRAKGIIQPETVLLNNDAASNGKNKLDVFNDNEAEVVNIDGINDISKRISDITFTNPTLNALYKTNMGVDATIYAAIAGVNANGKTIYLSGNANTDYRVPSIHSELEANGQTLNPDQLIKFKIDTSPDGTTINGTAKFDTTRTNASDFFSNLPTNIRFIGIAKINENKNEGLIVNPVTFDPSLSVNIPLNFSANNATFRDTLNADLSDLPGKGDEQQLSQATITINYTNGLPFKLNLSLIMLDGKGDEVTHYPLSQNPLTVDPASVNSQTGFVETGTQKSGKL